MAKQTRAKILKIFNLILRSIEPDMWIMNKIPIEEMKAFLQEWVTIADNYSNLSNSPNNVMKEEIGTLIKKQW